EKGRIIKYLLPKEVFADPEQGDRLCKSIGSAMGIRLTLIRPDGFIIGDTHEDPVLMNNHATRSEVRSAITGGGGISKRFSVTLFMDMIYSAAPVMENGTVIGVIRVALPVKSVTTPLKAVYLKIVLIGLCSFLVFLVLTLYYARQSCLSVKKIREMIHNFSEGNYSARVFSSGGAGLDTIAGDLNYMAETTKKRFDILTYKNKELETVLSGMIEAVIVVDAHLFIKNLNPAACRLIQTTPESARHKTLIEVFRNTELNGFALRVLSKGEPIETNLVFYNPRVGHNPVSFRTAIKGSMLHLHAHGNVLTLDEAGKEKGVLLVLNDITQLKNLEKVRKDFVANVSHELKTPITSIKGFVETLYNGAIDQREDALHFLEIISKHADRLNSIIDDLLSLSRLEQQDYAALDLEPVSVQQIVKGAIQICLGKARNKNISIELECDDFVRASVNALLIEQAIVNLIDNSIKFSEAGSVIYIHCSRKPPFVEISVKDSGCGIPQKDLPRIFERFYRVDKSRSRALGGTGLGLAIVKHIASAHKGEVFVESEPGVGSIFTIKVPEVGTVNTEKWIKL
ncbi:MAG: ATP-binding protein, partial [Spirochaetota bacterium]